MNGFVIGSSFSFPYCLFQHPFIVLQNREGEYNYSEFSYKRRLAGDMVKHILSLPVDSTTQVDWCGKAGHGVWNRLHTLRLPELGDWMAAPSHCWELRLKIGGDAVTVAVMLGLISGVAWYSIG